jgi:Na+-transporting methylmalonyl-CoA/oxaloacetate decarboxylase gamma subunit
MVLKFYIGLANILESWRFYIFNVLIPASLWLGVLLVIILIILLIFAFPAVAAIGRGIGRYLETKRKTKQKLELTAGTEAVNKLIDEATKSS